MAERRQLEFFLLRYVPDAVKGEFVNIGVVVKEIGANATGFADVRFTRDWRRVRCLDPQFDSEVLDAFEQEIREQLAMEPGATTFLNRFRDTFSNVLQISEAQRCLAENPAQELETIARMYLEVAKVDGQRKISGRREIIQAMRDAFVGAGLRGFVMERMPLGSYTKRGDPLKFIDFAYKANDVVKMFQAVSLKASVSDAVTLAARFPKIAPAVARNADAALSLTAVIDDDLDRSRDEVQFALSMMQEESIRIAVAAEMPTIAEVARQELRV